MHEFTIAAETQYEAEDYQYHLSRPIPWRSVTTPNPSPSSARQA